MTEPIPFAGNPLYRAANLRRDAAWLDEHLRSPGSRFLPFWRLSVLTEEASEPALRWLDASVCTHLEGGARPVFLGLLGGAAHFAVDLSRLDDPIAELSLQDARFSEPRSVATRLPMGDAGIVAHGRALLDWHARHRFCGACGSPTSPGDGGYVRKCADCGAEHFPRTDPVVIMVVWRGDKALLGRQRAWAPGSYSTLAGFIDQGETIEEAVRREVAEEVGLEVDEVTYQASQPWPFPSSLMIGCFAHAAGDDFAIDPVELDAARWFSRDELRRAVERPDPSLGFSVPGRIAIAHHLIKAWTELAT